MDSAQKNVSKYKAAFTTGSTKKDFCKTTPLKIVSGMSTEMLTAMGLAMTSYPTPIKSKG